PVWVPYFFRRRLDGSGVWAEGEGFWWDEILLPIVSTPFLWAGLTTIDLGWEALFMFGLVMPSVALYLLWSFVDRFWLRLVGVIDRTQEMEFLAYESLISQPEMAKWMGEVVVEWIDGGFVATGMLPG